MRNFRVVRDGVLYRSGQMPLPGLVQAIHEYAIRTVVNLRDGTTSADQKEEDYCRKEGIRFVRIPPRHWSGDTEVVPADEGIRQFREVMSDPRNRPVLIHCFAGIHRTGAFVAVYRMEYEGWPSDRAVEEMRACGYTNIDEELDVLKYMEQYRRAGKGHK
jgi:protein tyrosine/serine phosphatase